MWQEREQDRDRDQRRLLRHGRRGRSSGGTYRARGRVREQVA
jgi:hypothetical protein